MRAWRPPHEILVVYDFDEDTTVPVIERLHADVPAIRGLRNDLGRGVLNAMKAGIAASTGDYVLISMADGSDEPQVVDPMVELARGGADVVSASRYMRGGHQVGGPLLKRLMSRAAGLTLHWFGGVATHDPTNNFKLYSRRFLDATPIESEAGFELALELTVKATLARRRVAEVPTTWRDRTAGQSNFKLRKWLPHYLHWYWVAMRRPVDPGRRRGGGRRDARFLRQAMAGIAYRPDLDGLRAIAVGLVMLAPPGWPIGSNADIGVTAFFVLSGYLITSILVREPRANGPDPPRRVLPPPHHAARTRAARRPGLHDCPRARGRLPMRVAARHRVVAAVRLELGPGRRESPSTHSATRGRSRSRNSSTSSGRSS